MKSLTSFRTIGPFGASLSMRGKGDKIKFLMGYSGCPHSTAQLISRTAWCYRRFIKKQQITLRPIDRIKHWPRVAIDSLPSNVSARVERHGSRFFTRPRENGRNIYRKLLTANRVLREFTCRVSFSSLVPPIWYQSDWIATVVASRSFTHVLNTIAVARFLVLLAFDKISGCRHRWRALSEPWAAYSQTNAWQKVRFVEWRLQSTLEKVCVCVCARARVRACACMCFM